MSGFTAEDFARATLAMRGDYGVARRTDPRDTHQWYAYGGEPGWFSDEEMAADGWTPVVEADGPVATEGALRHVEERAERKRERLIRHISDLEGTIRRRGAALEDLREKLADAERRAELAEWTQDKIAGDANDLRQEIDRLERIIQAPLSMRDLEVAWEATEEADTCNAGDVLIVRDALDVFTVWVAPGRNRVDADTRVLSRAPREPWQDLADLLGHDVSAKQAEQMARRLHMVGVRVTGGDGDE